MSKSVKLKINKEQLILDKIHLLTDIILNIEYRNSIKQIQINLICRVDL